MLFVFLFANKMRGDIIGQFASFFQISQLKVVEQKMVSMKKQAQTSIFKDISVTSSIPTYFQNSERPIICYKYN